MGCDYLSHKQKCAPKLQHKKYAWALKRVYEKSVVKNLKTRSKVIDQLRKSSLNGPLKKQDLIDLNKKTSKKYSIFVKK
jgi:hypothetical protein